MNTSGQSTWEAIPLVSIAAWLVVGSLVIFAVADLTSFGVGEIERLTYALVCLAGLFAAAVAVPTAAAPRRTWLFISAWILAVLIFLVPTTAQRFVYPTYILGDIVSLFLPVLMFFVGRERRGLFSARCLIALAIGLLLASLTAPILGESGARFEPPPTLLIAISWWGTLAVSRPLHRYIVLALVMLVGALALFSGQRTALLLWIACGSFVLWRAMIRGNWARIIVLVALAIAAAITVSAGRDAITQLASGYRIASIAAGDPDDSLLARANEALDVSSTLGREGSPANWIVGFGHGATYRPQSSFLSRNVSPEGRVHNVHIGPLLILFRYGLLGIAVYLYLWLIAGRSMVWSLKGNCAPGLFGAFALATGAYLVEGLMFNVIVDPLFSYALAGLLASYPERRSAMSFAQGGVALEPGDAGQSA